MHTWEQALAERYPDPAERAAATQRVAAQHASFIAEGKRWRRRHPIAHAIDRWRIAQDMRRWKREDPTLYAHLTR